MTRINALRSIAETRNSVTWGKHGSIAVFAAVLIICSVTVGCSNDKPKPVSSNTQIPVTQPPTPVAAVPAATSAGREQAGSQEGRSSTSSPRP